MLIWQKYLKVLRQVSSTLPSSTSKYHILSNFKVSSTSNYQVIKILHQVPSTSTLLDSNPDIRNSWSDWCEMKRKAINRILGWLFYFALRSHPWPWLWSFSVTVWNSLISGWDGWLTWNKKDVSHPLMTMILTSVTVVGWVDVLDIVLGDLRRWCAIDINSF